MKHYIVFLLIISCLSCTKERERDESILADYIALNSDLESGDLVACAGGREGGLVGTADLPTDVFFYPIPGATDFRYFEATNVADSLNFNEYRQKELDDEPLFNGYLWKFNNEPFIGERMGIVTYLTQGVLHVCTPIRLKTNVKPTEVNPQLVQVTENGLTPTFRWDDGVIDENVIYFQMISDGENNLISGTYTIDKEFTFYDTSNVVFNITDSTTMPTLELAQEYKFSLMGVSEDNWVNLFFETTFSTH